MIARHEIEASIEDFVQISFYLLKDKRPVYMIYRSERLVDLISCFRQNKIEPKEIRFIQSKKDEKPNLFLIKGIKNGNPSLKIESPLIIYEENRTIFRRNSNDLWKE